MKYLKYLLITTMLLNLVSCDSYLDQVNPNVLSPQSIGESLSDLSMLSMGCYSGLQSNYKDGYLFLNCLTDVGYGEITITEGGSTPQTGRYQDYWAREYRLIVRCNELLAIIRNLESPTDEIVIIESETKFLRAFAYYHLTALYKDVPLIIDHQDFDDRFVEKNTQSEIKASILNDLEYAIDNLPVDQVYPKITKGAALTLKAKVHAYFGEWDEVLNLTKDILDLNKYDLFPDYETLFTPLAEGSEESIFAVAFETGIGQGESFAGSWPLQPWATGLRPFSNYADAFYCTDGLSIYESDLYNPQKFYENRDPRYEVSILRAGEPWVSDRPYDPNTSVTGYSTQKYVRRTTDMRGDGDQDFMIYRFADVLLLRAEALVETNNLNNEVYQLVNKVRSRVGMPSIEEVEGNNLSQSELRDLIRHERLVELGMEGEIRWFDIKSWGIVDDIYASITFHNRPFLGDKTIYWPIPQREIDNNPNLRQHSFWE